jgi:alpha-beta hydrolase superfamily lysophospholipase
MTAPGRQLEFVTTADGARLAVKRRCAAGTPIIFLHGLAVNADLWDLPAIRGPDFEYRSLASILHEAGYDLWLANFRGHGAPRMLSKPPAGQADWSVDHFVLLDLPAVVEHVSHATGRRPFVIGASMGSMTLAGFAEGAELVGVGGQAHIVADPELAARRAAQLAGAVFVEFPAALRWPSSAYDPAGNVDLKAFLRDFLRTDADVNYPFELLARWGWLETLIAEAGDVPLGWLRREPGPSWWANLPPPLAESLAGVERNVAQAMLRLAGRFTGARNYRADVLLRGRRYIMDHMKAGVLAQMAKSVRAGAFVSAFGTPDHVYSDHYSNVAVPTLVVAGGRDRIANPAVTREVFFERIQAADKTFRLYPEIAHGEFEAAPIATEQVYPEIRSWLDARDTQVRRA